MHEELTKTAENVTAISIIIAVVAILYAIAIFILLFLIKKGIDNSNRLLEDKIYKDEIQKMYDNRIAYINTLYITGKIDYEEFEKHRKILDEEL